MSQPTGISAPEGKHIITRAIRSLSTLLGVTAALMILIAVVITCQMIFVRFVLNESTIWQTEAVTYLMIAATLIGLPYVQLLRGHVNVDLLPMLLPPQLRKSLTLFVLLLSIAVIAVMAFHGFELFHIAAERGWRSDTVWGIKLWIPYLALPLGFGAYVLQMSSDIYETWKNETDVFDHHDIEEDY